MLRKSLSLLVLTVAAVLGYFVVRQAESPVLGVKTPPRGEEVRNEETATQMTMDFEAHEYSIYWAVVDSDKVVLGTNFDEQKISADIETEENCKTLINGGFYGKDGRPIGLFETQENEISPWQKNTLFNGVVSINSMGTPRITKERPEDPLHFALQTGPILKENGKESVVAQTESTGRRMVAAVTGENELIFITVFETGSVFSGPTLADLVTIITRLDTEKNLGIADAINLDGGSASAFYTESVKFSEASLIGSYFCEK